ncbi:MAG: hypothetical protein HC836_45880 [Richelia sp. RM2_1_2]|nr:hypothetical protein [Richelia sp. RM2_1_2]
MQLLEKSTYYQVHNVDANPVKHLETSTAEYIHASFLLWEYKKAYSKGEYRELLNKFGWDKGSTEEKRALKLAENFQDFAYRPHALFQIPVTKLLRLCSEKYQPIIEQLSEVEEDLTCAYVDDLIKDRQAQIKRERESALPSKPSIWRRNCRGERYAQFPPVYEEDQQTGVLTQKLIDDYGLIPQDILRSAIADLYEKIKDGEERSADKNVADVKENSTQEVNENHNQKTPPTGSSQTVEEKWEELARQLTKDVNNIGRISNTSGQLIVESCQRWEAAVPQDQRWDAVSNIVRRDRTLLKHLSNYACNYNPQWRENWGATLASYHNFEQELAWVDTDVRNDALISMGFDIPATVEVKAGNLTNRQGKVIGLNGENVAPILVKVDGFNNYFHWSELEIVKYSNRFRSYTSVEEAQEEYLEEPQEWDLELEPTPLDKAIDVLIQGDWEDIRIIFNQYPEVKGEAWNALCVEQKRRVIDITPDSVKVLNKAKKEGVIDEYKEIASGVYEIKLPGTIIWESRAFHEIEIYHHLRRWRENMSCGAK